VIVHHILVEVCGLTEVLRVHKQLLITTAEGKLRVQARVSRSVADSYVTANLFNIVGFEVFTAVVMKSFIFWDKAV
jgi:hypothetical protein